MKYLKTFEKYDYNTIDPFLVEMDLIDKITKFIKKYDLEYIDDVDIFGSKYYITLGFVGSYDDVLMKYKNPEDKPEEILIGIPRIRGIDVYEKILKQLNNLSDEDIENLKAKQNAKKYNL